MQHPSARISQTEQQDTAQRSGGERGPASEGEAAPTVGQEREATATVVRDLLSAGGVVAVKLGQVCPKIFDSNSGEFWRILPYF